MLPFLSTLADGQIHPIRDTTRLLATHFKLTDEELAQRLPSGLDLLFRNRVGWSRTYLKKAGLIETVARGQDRVSPINVGCVRPACVHEGSDGCV